MSAGNRPNPRRCNFVEVIPCTVMYRLKVTSAKVSAPINDRREDNVQLALLPIIARHNPTHELIEQRHRERGVSMTRTPNHSLGDQLISCRSERGDFSPQTLGHVAGTMRTRPDVRHRA